ncbi:MAG TPA: alpha/beta hydrolase [Mycobacterium sp.]
MNEIDLAIGRIRYRDEGAGPPIVFVHGVFVDGSLWRPVTERLRGEFRCITPDWPLGAHTVPSRPGADVSPRGVARAIAEFLDALDLRNVTCVANDTGGAITQLLLADGCDRVGQVVLTPCDSFDNFLPRSIRILQYVPRIPGLLAAGAQLMRPRLVQELTYRTLAKKPIPPETMRAWMRPFITDPAVRADVGGFLRAIDDADTLAAAERLAGFTAPVLLLWPRNAPFFPYAHAQRWAQILPNARLVEVPDSYTFVCRDQPDFVAGEIVGFAREYAVGPR